MPPPPPPGMPPRFIDENWVRSDRYHNSFLIKPDDALEHALKSSDENGLPQIAVSTAQGKLLSLIAKSINAKRILEVGTLGGYVILSPDLETCRSHAPRYSTIWLGRALPEGGKVITAELEEKHATVSSRDRISDLSSLTCNAFFQVARGNFEYAGLADKIEVRVGPAIETLKKFPDDEKFDLVFIDADKPSNPAYYKEARRFTRKGGVIVRNIRYPRGLSTNTPACRSSIMSSVGVALLILP